MTAKVQFAVLGLLAIGVLGPGVTLSMRQTCAASPHGADPAVQGNGSSASMRPSAAEALYRRQCQTCHGADGSARGLRSGKSKSPIPDFTSAAWHASRTDHQLVAGILNGMGDEMPAFADSLSPARARELVAHIRAFAPTPIVPAALTSDFDARFRELQQQWDDLEKQYQQLASPKRKP